MYDLGMSSGVVTGEASKTNKDIYINYARIILWVYGRVYCIIFTKRINKISSFEMKTLGCRLWCMPLMMHPARI